MIVSRATPKSYKDYLKAYSRWIVGGVQLCTTYSLGYLVIVCSILIAFSAAIVLPYYMEIAQSILFIAACAVPLFLIAAVFCALSFVSEIFQARCVQWISTSQWFFAMASSVFWLYALPFFLALGLTLPFEPFFFAIFTFAKASIEIIGHELTKSVVNKVTTRSGIKDESEYMRTFLLWLTMWPLNIYGWAHSIAYPQDWNPNPIPLLTRAFVFQGTFMIFILSLSLYTVCSKTVVTGLAATSFTVFQPAFISLIISVLYFIFVLPYAFLFFAFQRGTFQQGIPAIYPADSESWKLSFFRNYTYLLFRVPFVWVLWVLLTAVFLYQILSRVI